MPDETTPAGAGLDRFNALPDEAAERELLACCAVSAWARDVAAGRPYADREALLRTADAVSRLGDDDVRAALDAHPRIGDRARGASTEARWSRQEQPGVADADQRVQEDLRAGNEEYEQRFGHVFLVRAAGRSPQEMLAELRRRLRNDPATEGREVAEQLRQITRLRLERMITT